MKNKRFFKFEGIIILFLIINSCRDIIVPEISNKSLIILAPADSIETDNLTQTFWWEELDGADYYNLQIVKPDFASISQLILDSNCKDTKLIISLSPGKYQWRIRAVNNASATRYFTRSITIDSSSNIANQSVVLNSPGDNYITNQSKIFFKWSSLYLADYYRFRIIDSLNSFVQDTIIYGLQVYQTIPEGYYKWQVSGENSYGNTLFSSRFVSIDQSSPFAPYNLNPTNNDTTLGSTVQLTWNSDPTTIGDSIFVYSDVSLSILLYSSSAISNSYTFIGINGQSYYWRLRSWDSAGNLSNYTIVYRFNIP
jgi:hypothetical protein